MNKDDNDDEDEIKLNWYLKIEKDDMILMNLSRKREMIREEITLNMNNILTLFMNLSMINMKIIFSIIINSMKNLKKNIYIIHNDISLHQIPHFHFNHFKYYIKFDLFIFLSILYNKNLKWWKNNLFNHVSKDLRMEFMNKYLLSMIRDVIMSNENVLYRSR